MDNPWIIHGLSMDYPWIIHELSMDYPWILHGLSMHYHGLSMCGLFHFRQKRTSKVMWFIPLSTKYVVYFTFEKQSTRMGDRVTNPRKGT